MNIAVMGGSEFTLGFVLAGIKDVCITDKEPEKDVERALGEKTAGIIIIDTSLLSSLSEKTREKVEMSIKPVFVSLSAEASQESLRQMIIKSIGVDLMGD